MHIEYNGSMAINVAIPQHKENVFIKSMFGIDRNINYTF